MGGEVWLCHLAVISFQIPESNYAQTPGSPNNLAFLWGSPYLLASFDRGHHGRETGGGCPSNRTLSRLHPSTIKLVSAWLSTVSTEACWKSGPLW